MTTREFHTGEKRTADIVSQIVALSPGETLTLSLIEVFAAFGDGNAGLAVLREIAEDHNCYVGESDVLGVTITKL